MSAEPGAAAMSRGEASPRGRLPTVDPAPDGIRFGPVGDDEPADEDWDSLADSDVAMTLLAVLGVLGATAVLALGIACDVVLRALG